MMLWEGKKKEAKKLFLVERKTENRNQSISKLKTLSEGEKV